MRAAFPFPASPWRKEPERSILVEAPRFGATRRNLRRAGLQRLVESAMRRSGFAAWFLLIGLALPSPVAAACAPKGFDGATFTVCAFDPRRDDLRLFWKGADERPFGSLGALAEALRGHGQRLVFAMNAGMFREDQSPVGLYVENGRRLRQADTRDGGASNFRLKPNGVFWIGDGRRRRHRDRSLSRRPARRALRDPVGPDAGDRRPHPSEDPPRRHLGEDPQRSRRRRARRGRVRHRRASRSPSTPSRASSATRSAAATRCFSTARSPRSTRPSSSATTSCSRSDRSSGW